MKATNYVLAMTNVKALELDEGSGQTSLAQ